MMEVPLLELSFLTCPSSSSSPSSSQQPPSAEIEQDGNMATAVDVGTTPRLRREDLVSIPMLGDGNCLFHSLVSSLSSPDRLYPADSVRQDIVRLMRV